MKFAYTTKTDVGTCSDLHKQAKKLSKKVKPKDDDDSQIINAEAALWSQVPLCYQRAGDCDKAYSAFVDLYPAESAAKLPKDKEQRAAIQTDRKSVV